MYVLSTTYRLILTCRMAVSNLSAIFDIIKEGDPSLITYYNEEWAPINDPLWCVRKNG